MGRYKSRVDGFKSRKSHWICKACGCVHTVDKPTLCTKCASREREFIYFPSMKEFNRYRELKLMELAGLIDGGSIELQPAYKIVVTEKAIMDFRYTVHGRTVVEDVKTSGTDTNQSKRKRRAVLVQHGVEVVLV